VAVLKKNQKKYSKLNLLSNPWALFIGILLIYAALLLPTISYQGISWDEQTDIEITRSYLARPDGWLSGSPSDPSQTRLPMATVALFYELLHVSDLIHGRLISGLIGGLTLLGVFVYAKRKFGIPQGLLACGLLAISPFFLSFARIAFTETDIYLACAFIWLLVVSARMYMKPSISRVAVVGVVWGLAISAKFTAVAIMPVMWFAIWQARQHYKGNELSQIGSASIISLAVWTFFCLTAGWSISYYFHFTGCLRFIHYTVFFLSWAATLIWSLRLRQATTCLLGLVVFATGLGLLTFLVIPPEHLSNSAILHSLLWRAQNEMFLNPSFMFKSAVLHTLCVLFKSTPVIGTFLLLSLILMIFQWRRWKIQFPLLLVLFYFGALGLLPVCQTFYMIPLLPILAIFAADQLVRLYRCWRIAAIALAGLALVVWTYDMAVCYPDFNLDGYQYLGARSIAGLSSIGYRSVVQVTSDGVQQAFEWLNANANCDDQVMAFVSPWHIVKDTAPHPFYRIVNGLRGETTYGYPDYIVTHINDQISHGWGLDKAPKVIWKYPYDVDWLQAHYTKIFSVQRRLGIEMAAVWKKT
jgi:4-amino-4-deoxy-L-arabinose transferase-like glycosyltransferase